MNCLEEYIRDHKSLFDEEPAAGHFERLQKKGTRTATSSRQLNIALRWGISVAASIVLLLSAGLIWQNSTTQNGLMVCENAADMKICYLNKMNVVAGQIEALLMDFDQWDRQEVMNDVQDIIASADSGFENELPEELPDDLAKELLSNYYRQNLEGLEMIVNSIMNYELGITN